MTATSSEAVRTRIVEAFIKVVAERGYKAVTLDAVLAAAGVEEAEFRHHFGGMEDCFVEAWEQISAVYMPYVLRGYEGAEGWREQMRAIGEAILGYLLEHPDHARILYVEGPMPGRRARELLDRNVDVFIGLIDLGRRELDDPASLTRATAEGIAGSVYEQISICLQRGEDEKLPRLLPQLMFMVVRPYLGYEAAIAELQR